jgi:hypothetical protein
MLLSGIACIATVVVGTLHDYVVQVDIEVAVEIDDEVLVLLGLTGLSSFFGQAMTIRCLIVDNWFLGCLFGFALWFVGWRGSCVLFLR